MIPVWVFLAVFGGEAGCEDFIMAIKTGGRGRFVSAGTIVGVVEDISGPKHVLMDRPMTRPHPKRSSEPQMPNKDI